MQNGKRHIFAAHLWRLTMVAKLEAVSFAMILLKAARIVTILFFFSADSSKRF